MQNNVKLTISLICLGLTACDDDLSIGWHPEQHIRVYQDDQALACADTGSISVETHGKQLIDEQIELHCSQKGHDGMSYPQSCGSQTGSINIFTIHDKDLNKAESLGFSRLSTLPDAQFDDRCEYKVISDRTKYGLIHQLNDQHTKWQANKTSNYQFKYDLSYSDCPTFAPIPTVTITVNDDVINTVYDNDNETFITDIGDYMTIDGLFNEINLQLRLTPIEAGMNASEPDALPTFSNLGVPENYYINAGREECDAANYSISDFQSL